MTCRVELSGVTSSWRAKLRPAVAAWAATKKAHPRNDTTHGYRHPMEMSLE
jgi:hypothetical protein